MIRTFNKKPKQFEVILYTGDNAQECVDFVNNANILYKSSDDSLLMCYDDDDYREVEKDCYVYVSEGRHGVIYPLELDRRIKDGKMIETTKDNSHQVNKIEFWESDEIDEWLKKHKNKQDKFLHTHPELEFHLRVPEGHVIVDKNEYEKVMSMIIYGEQRSDFHYPKHETAAFRMLVNERIKHFSKGYDLEYDKTHNTNDEMIEAVYALIEHKYGQFAKSWQNNMKAMESMMERSDNERLIIAASLLLAQVDLNKACGCGDGIPVKDKYNKYEQVIVEIDEADKSTLPDDSVPLYMNWNRNSAIGFANNFHRKAYDYDGTLIESICADIYISRDNIVLEFGDSVPSIGLVRKAKDPKQTATITSVSLGLNNIDIKVPNLQGYNVTEVEI